MGKDAATTATTPRTVLSALTRQRLLEMGRDLGVFLSDTHTKDAQVDALLPTVPPLPVLVGSLGRDELRAVCRAMSLDDRARGRTELAARILGTTPDALSPPREPRAPGDLPRVGDIVHARHRQYLVSEVTPGREAHEATRVDLVCLDDDAQGRALTVFWEMELGARVLAPETHGLGAVARMDPPRHFAAYLHALRWNAVTATDARLFQAPFRAGIQLFNHQLTPLKRALEMPRANLYIADDVGLGKTIEAGLVLQELLLRQRVDQVLIVCPASVTLQWRDEMQKKFGLQFEIYDRKFVARRRQERGFGVNPWTTHTRFIISYQTLRRPEYRDPLLAHLGERAKKSLLILDEAHTAAPSTATRYAVDSRVTKVIRDVAPRFEHRLFLSATPHNGHSNSFSALLEILDPQRFTRGVPVTPAARDAAMVRRLKRDLRTLGSGHFPERRVIEHALEHDGAQWLQRSGDLAAVTLGDAAPRAEIELSHLLAKYSALVRPAKGPGRLVFVNLQKRLLSSVEAFSRTLRLHAKSVGQGGALQTAHERDDEDLDDDTREELEGAVDAQRSRTLPVVTGEARALLDQMLDLAETHRDAPDARFLALVRWIRENQCEGVAWPRSAKKPWGDRRVILFTEYGDTKRWIVNLLQRLCEDTDRGRERVMQFHGGMSDEQREEVQRAFNSAPGEHPVRILVATDAAREGVNLQGHCADLFHLDVPWNPARMEQRNGRIDRTLQPSPEVRCHYFVLPQRAEDQVLRTLVKKVERIEEELGSLSAVVMDRLADALEKGIDESSATRIEKATQLGMFGEATKRELDTDRATVERLKLDIDQAGRLLNDSRKVMEFDPSLLRDAINVGCELAGAKDLTVVPSVKSEPGLALWAMPELPESWQGTLDTLRPPRAKDEAPWVWRKRPLVPVCFDPPARINSGVAHLHLSHPVVQRILGRFLAQGWSAHDLSRVTAVRNPGDGIARVIVFGRLSLFGPGATRLHDQLVSLAAAWNESGTGNHLRPFAEEADRKALDRLEQLLAAAPSLEGIDAKVQERLVRSAPGDFAALWPEVEREADALAHDAAQKLTRRGQSEAEALRRILEAQRSAIGRELQGTQLPLFGDGDALEKTQWDQDRKWMERRLERLAREIETEPAELPELYRVATRKLEPVGMVYLWPGTR
jgi:ERCC4-related helicase